MAKKSKKKIARREYPKADVKELRAHSKARTSVDKIAKLTKRTVGSLRQKALKLGIGLADLEIISPRQASRQRSVGAARGCRPGRRGEAEETIDYLPQLPAGPRRHDRHLTR